MNVEYKKVVLLVEDDTIIALNHQRILKKHGYEVWVASCGEEAINLVERISNIGLVLMDIDLGPGLTGFETAKLIYRVRNIPLIFFSSYSSVDIIDEANSISPYGYFMKTIDEASLLQKIQTVLGGGTQRSFTRPPF